MQQGFADKDMDFTHRESGSWLKNRTYVDTASPSTEESTLHGRT